MRADSYTKYVCLVGVQRRRTGTQGDTASPSPRTPTAAPTLRIEATTSRGDHAPDRRRRTGATPAPGRTGRVVPPPRRGGTGTARAASRAARAVGEKGEAQ
nr:hypothetical protein KitaXyl93_04000 [Kitasatospora sp. Xyl93]